jgi:FixJ family two-component response regulator
MLTVLTPREREVVASLCKGYGNKLIARELKNERPQPRRTHCDNADVQRRARVRLASGDNRQNQSQSATVIKITIYNL